MKVLITGGAGFVGSTVGSALLDRGITPVILDNLVTGRREYTEGRIFYHGDVCDGRLFDRIFEEHPDIAAAVHCASLTVVPESVEQPLRYYRENVSKTIDMIGHLTRHDCRRVLFSSTAALYATGEEFVVDESSPLNPASPYAQTKAFAEAILADCASAGALQAISLRYFNPIGADPLMRTGLQNRDPSHALGKMIKAWERGEAFDITGVDWPTRDGTAIRDYIHIWDLARAHVEALVRFPDIAAKSPTGYRVINLGSGQGTTVRELLAAFAAVTGEPMPFRETDRRPGDIAGSFTRNALAAELLGWTPTFTVADGIRHAMEWRTLDSRREIKDSDGGHAVAAALTPSGN